MNEYASPFVQGLINLTKYTEGYGALNTMYDELEKLLLGEVRNAADERALVLAQGKLKLLHKIRTMPEEIIDRHIAQGKEGK